MSNFPTGNRTQLSWADVYRVARQAGFSPAAAVIATAITMPESGRYPGIQQSGQPYSTTGWGLWQITPGNSVPSVGVDNALLDPLTNARAAYAKYVGAGNSFRPWTTYVDGAYRAYLSDAQAAAGVVGNDVATTTDAAAAAAAGANAAAQAATGGTVPTSVLQAIQQFIGGGAGGTNPDNASLKATIDLGTIFAQDVGNTLDTPQRTGLAIVSGVVDFLSSLVSGLGSLVNGLLWLTHPYNWVRLFAGVVGSVSVLIGTVLVAKSA